MLSELERSADDLLDELLEVGEFEGEAANHPDVRLVAYEDQAEYETHEPVWSKRLPPVTHRVVVARAYAMLLNEGMNAIITKA